MDDPQLKFGVKDFFLVHSAINYFTENIDQNDYNTLHSKHICPETNIDITAMFCDNMQVSTEVQSIYLPIAMNYNDRQTSLMEIPCFLKRTESKKQAKCSTWVHGTGQCIQILKYELVEDDKIVNWLYHLTVDYVNLIREWPSEVLKQTKKQIGADVVTRQSNRRY
jgi:hypothetical protein